jgi:hypothetical protein
MFFAADVTATRDLACIIAADRFTQAQNQQLAVDLLRSFNDNEKMSGAILAALTGVDTVATVNPEFSSEQRTDLVQYWAEHAPKWSLKTVMHVALWMRGQPIPNVPAEGADGYIASMLVRDDLPWTTVMLALLHKKHPEATRFLFDARQALSDDPLDLSVDPLDLFDRHRWWRVFRRHRPDDRLVFWVWADPELEKFQVEVMRSWWLLHRHR